MEVRAAIDTRKSVRAFLDRAVLPATLHRIVEEAARAPSGGNLQPWHVDIVSGDALTRLKATMADKLARGEREPHGYPIYPPALTSPYRDRRHAVGEAMYGALRIAREDKAARRRRFDDNYAFFGARDAIFCTVDRQMGPPQWSDLGMFLQNVMLLAMDAGLATCAQECWAAYPATVTAFLGTPPERMLFCGMAIGYEDVAHPANAVRTARADTAEWLRVID
ncbi:MAG: nitroreductase [Novosphingobium sp.]